MAVLINLLPDQKIAKEKAQHQRQLAVSVASLVTAASLGLVLLLFLINSALSLRINQVTSDINTRQHKMLANYPDLKAAVTVQQHLAALAGLYDQRVMVTNLFDILSAASPKDYYLTGLTTDDQGTMKVTGVAKTYATIQRFAVALEESKRNLSQDGTTGEANFPTVQLNSTTAQSDSKIAFSLTATVSSGVTNGR